MTCMLWHKKYSHTFASHFAWSFDFSELLQRFGNIFKNIESMILMKQLSTTEKYSKLNLMTFAQKFTGMIYFNF